VLLSFVSLDLATAMQEEQAPTAAFSHFMSDFNNQPHASIAQRRTKAVKAA